jgi:hypothetical protein
VLNTEQYNTYKEYQDWQSEMRNSLPRGPGAAMVRMGVSGGGGPVMAAESAVFIAAPGMAPVPMPVPPQTQPARK